MGSIIHFQVLLNSMLKRPNLCKNFTSQCHTIIFEFPQRRVMDSVINSLGKDAAEFEKIMNDISLKLKAKTVPKKAFEVSMVNEFIITLLMIVSRRNFVSRSLTFYRTLNQWRMSEEPHGTQSWTWLHNSLARIAHNNPDAWQRAFELCLSFFNKHFPNKIIFLKAS